MEAVSNTLPVNPPAGVTLMAEVFDVVAPGMIETAVPLTLKVGFLRADACVRILGSTFATDDCDETPLWLSKRQACHRGQALVRCWFSQFPDCPPWRTQPSQAVFGARYTTLILVSLPRGDEGHPNETCRMVTVHCLHSSTKVVYPARAFKLNDMV